MQVFDFMSAFTSKVERLGLDEVFLDLTDLVEARMQQESSGATPSFVGHLYGADSKPSVDPRTICPMIEPDALQTCSRFLAVASQVSIAVRERA